MSRILRRNLPLRRSAPFIYVDLTSDSEDDHPDERLAQLRKHLFEISEHLTSDEDSSDEDSSDEDSSDEDSSDEDSSDEDSSDEDSSTDEGHCDEKQYYTSDESQDGEP